MSLTGKTAFVTGGARGIGLATVRAFLDQGVEVTFTARSKESLNEALEKSPGARGVICDITDAQALAKAMRPGFDILVNNAATIGPIGHILDITAKDFAEALSINLAAQLHLTQLALPYMLKKGAGTIINISSGAAHKPKEGWTAYCTSKAGFAMLTQMTALEYGAKGIRCFGLAPGVVDTDMQGVIRASGINEVSRLPRSALSAPSEPAQMIAWLCTPAADYLAGQELDIRTDSLRVAADLPR